VCEHEQMNMNRWAWAGEQERFFFIIFYWHMAHNITWHGRIFCHVSQGWKMEMDAKMGEN
jgi:hypothetical protein